VRRRRWGRAAERYERALRVKILRILSKSSITYIDSRKTDGSLDLYDAVLEFGEDGGWTLRGDRAQQMVAMP
jgi:hypothetical protein